MHFVFTADPSAERSAAGRSPRALDPDGAALLGSVVSQGLGVATGIQDKFSWKGVAMAAIAGGVSGGLGKLPGGVGKFLGADKLVSNIARGALGNALTQGVAVATGLQNKFDWTGVAVGGVVGGAIGGVSRGLASKGGFLGIHAGADSVGSRLVSGMAAAIAGGATRSLLDGTDFGDNILAALPDVIGSTIGGMVADSLTRSPRLAYGNVSTNDGLAGGGTTGAGDGTQAQPVAGVAGGGQVGGSASGDAQAGDIVVTADPHMRDLYRGMSNFQWNWYFGQAGQRNDHGMAHMALSRTAPTVSWGAVSSYDSPLVKSLKMAQPFGLYSGPAQQYMLGDGAVFTGTLTALSRFQQQRSTQADGVYLERLRRSTFGGIALGVANGMGASPATQDLVYDLVSSADGLLIARGATAGARVPGIGNQLELNIVNGANGVHGNSRLSGRTTWLYELSQRNPDGTQAFLKYGISLNPSTRYSTTFMKDKLIDPIASGTRADMLALERQMVTANPGPLNMEPWAVKARGGN